MPLTGDLGAIELANVFQMLHLSQKTGTLEVRTRGGRVEMYLEGEYVQYPFDRDAFPTKVVRRLEREGKLQPGVVSKAQASLGVVHRDLFTILLQMRAVTIEDVTTAYRAQMEEEIYEIFVDRDATFEFRENERPSAPGKVIDDRYRLVGAGLIMEAARRIDEWGHVRERVPSDRCVFECGGSLDTLSAEERDGELVETFGALDGLRSVLAIVEQTGLTRFSVCKKLALLAEKRLVYEVPVEVLLERAKKCLREEKGAQGLALLERAFELGADDPAVHEMAALANQAMRRVGEAGAHLALVADAMERAGDRRSAADVHLRIRDLLTDVRAREKLVHHWLDDSEFFRGTQYDAETEATELVTILGAVGRVDEARELVVEVQKRSPQDGRMAVRLADLSLELGDPKSAVAMLLACGDELMRQRRNAAALQLYRRLRSIDPQHEGLDVRLSACERVAVVPLDQRRRMKRVALGGALVVAFVVVLFVRNHVALRHLEEIDTESLAFSGDFENAIAQLDAFKAEHVLTVAGVLADRRLHELEERARDYGEARVKRRSQLDQDRARRQKLAERAYQDAFELMNRGDQVGALASMKRAAELANDPRFLHEKKPAEKAEEMRAYLDAAKTEYADYDAARQSGDWPTMRRAAFALLRDHARAPEAAKLVLPIRIRVDPADATIALEPKPDGGAPLTSPAVVLLAPHTRVKVTATSEGRFPCSVDVDPETDFEVSLALDRRADQSIELQSRALAPPVVYRDRAFFACADGRVAAIDTTTLATVWQHTLKELEEVGGPPCLDGQGLRIPLRRDKVVWLDPATGEEVHKQPDAGGSDVARFVASVALNDGGTLVAESDGRLVQRDAAGQTVAVWRSSAPLEWGVAVPGGVLFGRGTVVLRVVPKSEGGDGR
jgi:hypothetical protein